MMKNVTKTSSPRTTRTSVLSMGSAVLAWTSISVLTGCATGVDAEDNADQVASLESALLSAGQCEALASQANGTYNAAVLDQARAELIGDKKDTGLGKRHFEITGVESATFTGCSLRLHLNMKLRRPGLRRDGKGTADAVGTVYAAKRHVNRPDGTSDQSLICLRDVKTENFDLSHTTNVAENIFGRHGDGDDECFDAGSLWSDFEVLANALGEPLQYEWQPDLNLDS